jgi:hypothetical protein
MASLGRPPQTGARMFRALAKRQKGYYDPSIYGYHPAFDIEAEAGVQGKAGNMGGGPVTSCVSTGMGLVPS